MTQKIRASFDNIIDAYLSMNRPLPEFHFRIERNSEVGFHPSEMHNVCPRYLAFKYFYESNKFKKEVIEDELYDMDSWINARLRKIFDTGHSIHALIQYAYLPDYYKNEKVKPFEVEKSVKGLLKKYLISGTADVVIKLQDGKVYIVDIKTIAQEKFYCINSTKDVVRELGYGYIVQLMLYCYGLKIKRAKLYLWNKNRGETKEIDFNFDEWKKHISKPLTNAKKAKEFIEGKREIKILSECKNNTTERYKNCPFNSICFSCKSRSSLNNLLEN